MPISISMPIKPVPISYVLSYFKLKYITICCRIIKPHVIIANYPPKLPTIIANYLVKFLKLEQPDLIVFLLKFTDTIGM